LGGPDAKNEREAVVGDEVEAESGLKVLIARIRRKKLDL
jgi:hypothetical protein